MIFLIVTFLLYISFCLKVIYSHPSAVISQYSGLRDKGEGIYCKKKIMKTKIYKFYCEINKPQKNITDFMAANSSLGIIASSYIFNSFTTDLS